MARRWEVANARPYLFAGVGAGADIAAWKQAARAEIADAVDNACYGQTLLDLVKAFDRVPHHVLVREALALDYCLWILRLALAAYRAVRRIRIDGALSAIVVPMRGITAGSGLATTEMRVLMLRIVDGAWRSFPLVVPTLFVDDLSAEASGGPATVLQQLSGFTLQVCDAMTADMLEVSAKKSCCTASSAKIGALLQVPL